MHELLPNGSHYFVDLAANEAIELSNTYALERAHGWRGVCIEANPRYHSALRQYRTCNVVAAAIADEERQYEFTDKGAWGGLSGANGTDVTGDQTSFRVGGLTFRRVLKELDVPLVIDYLSLDVRACVA